MQPEDALNKIRELVGHRGRVDDASLDAYLIDERKLYQGAAALVVRPGSVMECAEIVRFCQAGGLHVVPQGGNTGYCGGATPFDPKRAVLVNMSRMDRIRNLDPVGSTMTVEAGVVLARAQEAAREAGLLFPLSMGSEGSCQIGGNLSTNAGGLAVLRYGTARELVLGLEVVLPDGQILEDLRGLRKDNTGYDLKGLFLGAEGTLGLITAAVVKLFPAADLRETALLAVPDPAAACALLARARATSGDAVSSFELIARSSLELVLEHVQGVNDPMDEPHPFYVLVEMSSAGDAGLLRASLEGLLEGGFEAGEILDGAIAESGPQRDELWRLRESVPEAERHAGGALKHDISVRISAIPQYLDRAAPVLAEIGDFRLSLFGHIGDGNLHFNLLPPEGASLESFRDGPGVALSAAVHGLAAEMGGSFSAEHGVGILKRAELGRYRSATELDVMRQLKAALDPNGLFNPGKVLPDD
jgi:D-lactate dehydrogenase (cytochrome)